jgi:hypothetical protein
MSTPVRFYARFDAQRERFEADTRPLTAATAPSAELEVFLQTQTETPRLYTAIRIDWAEYNCGQVPQVSERCNMLSLTDGRVAAGGYTAYVTQQWANTVAGVAAAIDAALALAFQETTGGNPLALARPTCTYTNGAFQVALSDFTTGVVRLDRAKSHPAVMRLIQLQQDGAWRGTPVFSWVSENMLSLRVRGAQSTISPSVDMAARVLSPGMPDHHAAKYSDVVLTMRVVPTFGNTRATMDTLPVFVPFRQPLRAPLTLEWVDSDGATVPAALGPNWAVSGVAL